MSSNSDYRYCPYCGQALHMRARFGQARPTCVECEFVYFRDPKVAVIALVTWQDRVLLIRRGVDPMKGKWALPGGFMDAGEMPQAALTRELREEVGLDAPVAELLEIFPMAGPGVLSRGIVLAFRVAMDATHAPDVCSQDDIVEAAWFRAWELPADLAFDSTNELLAQWRTSHPATPTVRPNPVSEE